MLDELGQQKQIACIRAIDDFLSEHQALSAIVCCRKEEYETGQQQLTQLRGAIYLQSLSSEQIHQYLRDLKRKSLWHHIQTQPELLDLAKSPLFLTMLVVAYKQQAIRDKESLFDAYIQKQLHDPNNQGTYGPRRQKTPKQTQHYLHWLATKLEERRETEFLIENLQPDWLLSKQQKRIYRLSVGLIDGLIFGLIGGLIFGLIGGLIGGLRGAMQHGILRIILTKNDHIPWNYAKFLEHAVQHRFIQRTGGRYRFIHDLLRKHFAQMPSPHPNHSNT